jgi:GT2 family glycosyltransferase
VKTDIILPFHNGVDMLIRCLGALSAARMDANVFLVDDGSEMAERQRAQRAVNALSLPVTWINSPRRLKFVKAVNLAWQRCTSPVVVILNSDTVPPADLLAQLTSTLDDDPRLAAVAPTSNNPVDLYQHRLRKLAPHSGQSNDITNVPYLTAMCLAIRRYAVAGPVFDPAYSPGYFEDLDLSCRLRSAGWRLSVVEGCRIRHQGKGTFGRDPERAAIVSKNYSRFASRWSHLPEHSDLVLRLSGSAVQRSVRQ